MYRRSFDGEVDFVVLWKWLNQAMCSWRAVLLLKGLGPTIGQLLSIGLAGMLAFIGAQVHAQTSSTRHALVIGNAAYINGPLKNPVNDAQAMDRKLAGLGFNVQRVENFVKRDIGRILPAFISGIRPGDEVVIFYAGHGLQVKGVNYLPAVDADIQSEDDVPLNSLNLNTLMERLDDARPGLKLIFLDACRNNPYARSFRSGDRGLARVGEVASASGTLINFATLPGQVAADGTGSNGLYTSQLLRHLDAPNVTVETMLKRVAADVRNESKGVQQPWSEGMINGEFFFRRLASVTPEPQPSAGQIEQQAWSNARAADTADAYDAYLTVYPQGLFAIEAVSRRKSLLNAKPPVAATAPATMAPPPAGTAPVVGAVFEDCTVCPKLVVVASGKFSATATATAKDGPKRKEFGISKGFAVGINEITFKEWDACAADGACPRDISDEGWGRDNQPAINVSWNDAKTYLAWLNRRSGKTYRLLREAEWEYVARAGSTDPYPWGRDSGFDNANCLQCGAAGYAGKRTAPAGTFPKNGYGLHDVIGNVWEWVEDCDSPTLKAATEPASDDSGSCTSRVLRGGSFKTAAKEATVENRRPANPTSRSPLNGFRVARDL